MTPLEKKALIGMVASMTARSLADKAEEAANMIESRGLKMNAPTALRQFAAVIRKLKIGEKK